MISAMPIHPKNKTKIVCTIGPASDSPAMLQQMIMAGMNVARLNFSHGDFNSHGATIGRLRDAATACGRRVAILADLPGPKMRIGELREEPITLEPGQHISLTSDLIEGDASRVHVTLEELPAAVKPGDRLFLNDGLIALKVLSTAGNDIHCEVKAGGELRSRKGLNLPGIDLGISAFTPRDRECLAFALEQGVDAVSQSFVDDADDIHAVREAAARSGRIPFIIAKIERAGALDNLDAILDASDGLMVARGDLGVEIPLARIAVVQKEIMRKANRMGKPVITATQMLESMTDHRRPTRAEATDVANAILDGTDAVMLSGESAMGRYPLAAVEMLAEIAAETEPHRKLDAREERLKDGSRLSELIAHTAQQAVLRTSPSAVVVPTRSGAMARAVARFRLPQWVTALSTNDATCQALQFSYGVHAECVEREYADWTPFVRQWSAERGIKQGHVVLTQGPSPENPCGNHRLEIIDLDISDCVLKTEETLGT